MAKALINTETKREDESFREAAIRRVEETGRTVHAARCLDNQRLLVLTERESDREGVDAVFTVHVIRHNFIGTGPNFYVVEDSDPGKTLDHIFGAREIALMVATDEFVSEIREREGR